MCHPHNRQGLPLDKVMYFYSFRSHIARNFRIRVLVEQELGFSTKVIHLKLAIKIELNIAFISFCCNSRVLNNVNQDYNKDCTASCLLFAVIHAKSFEECEMGKLKKT